MPLTGVLKVFVKSLTGDPTLRLIKKAAQDYPLDSLAPEILLLLNCLLFANNLSRNLAAILHLCLHDIHAGWHRSEVAEL